MWYNIVKREQIKLQIKTNNNNMLPYIRSFKLLKSIPRMFFNITVL